MTYNEESSANPKHSYRSREFDPIHMRVPFTEHKSDRQIQRHAEYSRKERAKAYPTEPRVFTPH